jgi:ribosomal protein L16/L10AE
MEQVSFKGRNFRKTKKIKLNYGNSGFIILKNIQFEYAYFYLIKRFLKYFFKFKYTLNNYFKIWIFLKGNFPVSRKSKNSRMGKGKGSFTRWIIKLNQGHTILEFENINLIRLKKLKNHWNKLLGFNIHLYIK